MKKFLKKIQKSIIISLTITLLLTLSLPVRAADSRTNVKPALNETAAYLLKTVSKPDIGSVGGEWAVMGLARSNCDVPQSWYNGYYNNIINQVQASNGVLREKKYTEYSRVILALTAIGKNPADVGGCNFLTPLGDYEAVIEQGINGPIFALLALDSGDYAMPVCETAKTPASRNAYIAYILSKQLSDGGWSLSGSTSEPDVTGMALQALAKYQSSARVKPAIDKAVACLSEMQDGKGGFSNWGGANAESTVQVIMALCELKIDPQSSLFTKNDHTLLDNLLSYYVVGGGFKHTTEETAPNIMGTEQGFYTLVGYLRFLNGQNSFYDMRDAKAASGVGIQGESAGLAGKNAAVNAMPVTKKGQTFDDITGLDAQKAIEALASRGIINGVSDTAYEPDRNMTRAEFATIVVRALGLAPATKRAFTDVAETSWYDAYVGTAYTYGIVSGTSETTFAPEATITREEATTMVARAAKLCGMDTEMTDTETRDMLAQFADYTTSADWAREALAFCYKQGILPQDDLNIEPKAAITRSEIAAMLYRMLIKAELI
jgi:hypothetical protein